MISGSDATWTPPRNLGNSTFYNDADPARFRKGFDTFDGFKRYEVGYGGQCSVYDPPVSYWCSENPAGGGAFRFTTPSGVMPKKDALPNAPYRDPSQALFFVWRPARWANWMFELDGYNASKGKFDFGRGGFQGARGSPEGGDFFVENVMEELDHPGEFFFNETTAQLYLFHNATAGTPPRRSARVVAPQRRVLVNATGTQWRPVRGVRFEGVRFEAAASTYMEPHGVPSAGDWALARFGAVFLQGTEGFQVDGCTFDRLDGNGVMISGYNRNATVSGSDFAFIGGNAVAAWGFTNETASEGEGWPEAGVDGTDGRHPRYTKVRGNLAREVGLYEKQSSFFVQAKTAQSFVEGNVFFNGPRAGINFNDGFGGGDVVDGNLVFSTCRESGDHGPLNSWDRQPFLTTVRTGQPSMVMAWRNISRNFFIDNYSPQEDVDNDDGSSYYHTHDNFLVYGAHAEKSDFAGHRNVQTGNIFAYTEDGLSLMPQEAGFPDEFSGNRLIITGNDLGQFTCGGAGEENGRAQARRSTERAAPPIVHSNAYYTENATFTECKMSLAQWQAKGGDKASVVEAWPSDEQIMRWAREKLGF
jgi:hypothetical protein